MALDTYTNLQTSIGNWLDRSDLASVIPDFIALFEATANTESAIRTQFNKTSTTGVTVASLDYIPTPSDFLGAESLVITKGDGSLMPLDPKGTATAMYSSFPNAKINTALPEAYLNLASKLELAPTPDAAYTYRLYYYQKIPALASNASNWLLTNYPNIYLFGSLVAAEAYLGTDSRLQLWGTLYDNAIQKLQGATDRNKYGGSALTASVDVVT